MKKIPLFFIVVITIMFLIVRCDNYDDSEVKADIAELQSRVSALEDYCSTLNSQITSLQSAVTAIENYSYVSGVSSIIEDGEIIGYTISFSDGSSITIYNGTDGEDGSSGSTPVIGVTLIDGVYYWTLNDEVIVDSDGNMIRAAGSDGSTGTTPQLKIGEDGYWYVSYDGGENWTQLGAASEDTIDYITSISMDDGYVFVTLYDGTILTIAMSGTLDIDFEIPEGLISSNQTVGVNYTVINGSDEKTSVEALAQDDYYVYVSATDSLSGTISITAPEVVSSTEIFVLVSNNRATIMRILSISDGGLITYE